MEQIKKDKLIIALQEEKNLFTKNGHNTKDHEYSIHYLRTGEISKKVNIDYYEILDACVNDIECLYNDYCV